MKFMLFDRREKYIGNLSKVTEASHSMELNGRDTLDIETFTRMEIGYKIITHSKKTNEMNEFIIADVEEFDEDGKILYKAYCESSFYEIMFDFISDSRAIDTTALEALQKALAPTRWTIGHVDDLGLGTATFYRTNAKTAVEKILETWRCELHTTVYRNNITGDMEREVNLYRQRGEDSGKRLTYKSGMLSVSRKTLREDIITALYGFGKGEEVEDGAGYGRRLDFSSINNGKAYLENPAALQEWGRRNSDGTIAHKFGVITYDDIDDIDKLMAWTAYDLEIMSKPRISYEVKALDLSEITGETYYKLNLGDYVKVLDHAFTPPINHSPRVVQIVKDLLHEENTDVTLGEREIQESERQVKRREILDRIISKEGAYDKGNVLTDGGDTPIIIPPEPTDAYYDFDIETRTITKYYRTGKNETLEAYDDIVIPSTIGGIPVEIIGESSFSFGDYTQGYISSVIFPSSIKKIGHYAFQNNRISSITLPANLVEIGDFAFHWNRIELLTIPYGVTIIGNSAFSGNQIAEIIIPDSVSSLGQFAFENNMLTSYRLPANVGTIPAGIFQDNYLSDIYIPGNILTVGYSSFFNQNVPMTIIVGSQDIESGAFGSNIIESLTLKTGIITIGQNAFSGVEGSIEETFTDLELPDTITDIGPGAFRYNKISSLILSKNLTELNQSTFADNDINAVFVPSSVVAIKDNAFNGNNIMSVNIPDSVDSLFAGAFDNNPIVSITLNRLPLDLPLDSQINGSYVWKTTNEETFPVTFILGEGGWQIA